MLARQGKIDAYKEGRNWLLQKKAINDYINIRQRKVYFIALSFFNFFTFVYLKIELKSVSLRFAKTCNTTEETIEIIEQEPIISKILMLQFL